MIHRIVVVTGGTRGIGAKISEVLLKRNIKVISTYSSNYENAMKFKENMNKMGLSPDICKLSIENEFEVIDFFESIKHKYKKIDALINNAGINHDALIDSMSSEQWNSVIDINLSGTFYCSKYALPLLKLSESPSMINISSINGLYGTIGQANYVSTKAGIIGLTKTLAKELKFTGIRVNALAPGLFQTDMEEGLTTRAKSRYLETIPSGKIGNTKYIADLVGFLISEKSKAIHGQIIPITGGIYQ